MTGRRWKQKEQEALDEVKRVLKDELAARPQFPDVIGDRRLIRFLRGRGMKVDETIKSIRAHFKWRDENHVDEIRQDILYGGKNAPSKFPMGELILGVAPQIIISANALDRKGRPLAMETFDFSPKEMFEAVTIKEYLHFLIYTLEYRALVLEQLSQEREQQYLQEHPDEGDREDGYGVTVMDYTIRDLRGVGMGHLGSKGRALVAAALEAALPNYPEFLERCVIINTPWVFTTFWYFVKGFLDEIILEKVAMCGTNYMPVLLADTTMESIPECLGGTFKLFNEPFEFDCSVGGPLHYPGAPPDPKQGPAGAGSATSSTSTSTSNTGHHGDHPSSTGAQKGVGGRPAGGVSTLFPDMDSDGFPPAARTSPRLAPLLERTFSGNGSCGSASGSGSGSGSTHQQTTRTRSGSGTALGRVSMNGKPLDVEGMSHGVVQHIASWVRNNPLKAGLTLVWAVIFAWVRSTGWLQLMVYPAIVYVTIFDTKAIVRSILSHFDIELKARSTVK